MPLITITGYPTAGKTHRARQLHDYFTARIASPPSSFSSSAAPIRIHHITDTALSIPRTVYDLSSHTSSERSDNAAEKDARAKVYAEVKRLLSKNDIVILDAAAGSYIKGWRYQLYCEAKALHTASCVVHVGTGVEAARAVNEERLRKRDGHLKQTAAQQEQATEGNGTEDIKDGAGEKTETENATDKTSNEELPYERETWENLVFRYEEPNGMTRWDSPLFTVVWDDALPPCDDIWAALFGTDDKKVLVRPNQATVARKVNGEGYLYELDRSTQDIVAQLVSWGRHHEGEGGGEVTVGGSDWGSKEGKVVSLPAEGVNLPALQRLRRQFISMNRLNAVDVERIRESFVGYLNDSFAAN